MWSKSVGRLRSWQPYLLALAIYIASRALVMLGLWFGNRFVPFNAADWHTTVGSHLFHHLLRWDSFWYLRILTGGYTYDGNPTISQPVSFYPLYPLLSRYVAALFRIEGYDALLLVSNAAAVAAILLLTKLTRRDYGDDTALRTVAFVSFFPSSLFLSAGLTEGPALVLILLFFLLMRDERWLAAAACAALAGAMRATGLVLLPVLAWALWSRFRSEPRRLLLEGSACMVIAVSGLAVYMIYLWISFGDPLAFVRAHEAWEGGSTLGSRIFDAVSLKTLWRVPHSGLAFDDLRFWFFVVYAALAVLCWRRLPAVMTLFSIGVLLLPYLTISNLASMNRYGYLAFPLFIALAELCQARAWLTYAILGLSGGLLVMSSALFGQWYWIG